MSFQDELNNIILNESNTQSKQIETARQYATFDFNKIKSSIKYAVESQNYTTASNGSHFLSVMIPPYPNTTGYIYAREYLQIKTEFKTSTKRVQTGFSNF